MTQAMQKTESHEVSVPDVQPSQVLEVISRAASDPNIDIDKFERLMQMHERIMAKNAEAQFNAAFSEMQSEIPVITEKGEIKVNGEIRSRYAKNEDIQETIKPILKAHGFSLSFRNEFPEAGRIKTIGTLAHKAGHKIEGEFVSKADTSGSKNEVQSYGSSSSYGKRYVTEGLLNIVSRGQDDDGGTPAALITEEQVADLNALILEVHADFKRFLKHFKIQHLEDLPVAKYKDAVAALERKRK